MKERKTEMGKIKKEEENTPVEEVVETLPSSSPLLHITKYFLKSGHSKLEQAFIKDGHKNDLRTAEDWDKICKEELTRTLR